MVGPAALALRAAMLGAVVGGLAWLSLHYTRQPTGLSTLWAASGVLCGVLLTTPRARWPWYLVAAYAGNVLARWLHHDAAYSVLGLGLLSLLDGQLTAWWVARQVGDITEVSHIQRTARVATIAAVAASALTGLAAAALLAWFVRADFAAQFGNWFAAHALGLVIFATLTAVLRTERARLLGRPGRRVEFALLNLVIAAAAVATFGQAQYPLLFVVHPLLLLAAFRHRFAGLVSGTLLVGAIAILATFSGHGPFAIDGASTAPVRSLLLQCFIASTCLVTIPVAVVLSEYGWLTRRLRASERNYRILADYSRDLIVRIGADGVRRYISSSATAMLGWSAEELRQPRWDLVHPDDLMRLREALGDLRAGGGSTTVAFRTRHKDGHYVWIEAKASLVPAERPGDPPEIIYSGRDVTARMAAEQALAHNQRRLRAITDNLPAFVIHVDKEEKYTFANAYTGRMLGVDPATLVGRGVREVMGEGVYAEIKPHIDAALRGDTVTFEIEREFQGWRHWYQSTYVPDVAEDGTVLGFYAVTFDISRLKRAEHELMRLVRYDNLTGLANRLHFNERLELAVARHRRTARPVALLYLDIDRFKQINDTLGHATGDAVLCEFAERLRHGVRATDFAARLGGDEFVVLIEDADAEEAAETVARKLIGTMRDGVRVDGHVLPVTISVGIAFCRGEIENADAFMHRADTALYQAKAAGRNTYRLVH